MFKKLKDKLAEEVKSSPQRIQQFAQAAQAAVTSASSSISDITNNDLFSIGDSDSQQTRPSKAHPSPSNQRSTFQEVNLIQPGSSTQDLQNSIDSIGFTSQDLNETPRQRRLSNSSFASDVSFRLPSYESPSMYHLQSDMEVSASEAEERGFSSGAVSLDRVTKEQIYAAYRRTQERYTKYRTQYADLARHYKLLERDNAKARSVLVETQDKALRRISELREQCSLEQSAKAHLEKALRVEIEEKNIKIETLDTKIKLLQDNTENKVLSSENGNAVAENDTPLITLSIDTDNNQTNDVTSATEIAALKTKIEKLEMLANKYKDSFKTMKEKNVQITNELKMVSSELVNKKKENQELQVIVKEIDDARQRIQELNDINEELQNKINAHDFNKTREISTIEMDLQKAREVNAELQKKITIFIKREEEYAISLAENKLSIHKELESKEAEIKSLTNSLAESKTEIQSLNIVINNYKTNIAKLEEERSKWNNDINECNILKSKLTDLESQLKEVSQKCQSLENLKAKADEEYKCLQLQLKQETAEKLAVIDRNTYLENRNTQLSEENVKKSKQISDLDNELHMLKKQECNERDTTSQQTKLIEEIDLWKKKCSGLESEIQEEREELGKLQSEIEKLLANHEHVQILNTNLNTKANKLHSENEILRNKLAKSYNLKSAVENLVYKVKDLRNMISSTSEEAKMLKQMNVGLLPTIQQNILAVIHNIPETYNANMDNCDLCNQYIRDNEILQKELREQHTQLFYIIDENERLKAIVDQIEKTKEENDKLRIITEQLIELQNENVELKSSAKHEKIDKENEELKSIAQQLDEIKKENEKLILATVHINEIQNENENLKANVKSVEAENKYLREKLEFIIAEHESSIAEVNILRQEKQELTDKIEEFQRKYKELRNKLDNDSDKRLILEQNIHEMNSKILKVEEENKSLYTELDTLSTLKEKYTTLLDKTKNLEEEKILLTTEITQIKTTNAEFSVLIEKLKDVENENICLKSEFDSLRQEHDSTKLKLLQLNTLENERNNLIAEIGKFKTENDSRLVEISELTAENDLLTNKLKAVEDKVTYLEKLQNSVKDLTQENISLRNQCEGIADNVKSLECELSEVRKAHAEIEIEKDRLSSVIEKLEKIEHKVDCIEQDTQTMEHTPDNVNTKLSNVEEQKTNGDDNLTSNSNALHEEYNLLKEENRRLQSDISGLQTYLTQISKENSILNDKMRELISSGENTSDKSETLSELKNEVDLSKDKINDLIRENSLLIEENLELKDQLNLQKHSKTAKSQADTPVKDTELLNLKDKYSNLLDTNNTLEKRLKDLELMNKSINNSMTQVQENNEKLRLSNDKLERRLDEALVSLRHLHSLQENTELEYLKNILYEYLTGTGTHSVTLAKVLAAVVKFDDAQTQQVLQKEKERQGFLRQLGII